MLTRKSLCSEHLVLPKVDLPLLKTILRRDVDFEFKTNCWGWRDDTELSCMPCNPNPNYPLIASAAQECPALSFHPWTLALNPQFIWPEIAE